MPGSGVPRRGSTALVALLLALVGCSEEAPKADDAPTVVDRTRAGSPTTDNESYQSAEPVYEDQPDVIVDENGRRSFPTQSPQQELDLMWEQVLITVPQGDPIPTRPKVELVYVDNDEERLTGYVTCMEEQGWTGIKVTETSIDSPEIPPGQFVSYAVADYQCQASHRPPPITPRDESDMERLYDHQVDYVIPCLAEKGHTVANFPSKESFVDRYFAERTYTLATALAGLSEDEEWTLMTDDPEVECHAFPESP